MKNKLNVVRYDASYQKLASSFESGNLYLDVFLKHSDSLDNNYGQTYVWLSESGDTIIGYYNIGVGYIEQIVSGTTRKIGGAIHINCFALDQQYQGILQDKTPEGVTINLSDILLHECFDRVMRIRGEVGFAFITLCSTKQGYNLYKRNGFDNLDEDMRFSTEDGTNFNVETYDNFCAPMYLPLDLE